MPSSPVDVVTLIVQQAGIACAAGKQVNTDMDKSKVGLYVASGASFASSELMKLFLSSGGTLIKTTSVAGSVLGAVPVAIDLGKAYLQTDNVNASLELPKLKPFSYQVLLKEQRSKTKQAYTDFNNLISARGKPRVVTASLQAMKEIILGVPLFSKRSPGLKGLQEIGNDLKLLPPEQKKAMLDIILKAVRNYDLDKFHVKQSANSSYLTAAFATYNQSEGDIQRFLTEYIGHGIHPEVQALMKDPAFPNNITPAMLADKKFYYICDNTKLHLAVEIVKAELMRENDGELLTQAELDSLPLLDPNNSNPILEEKYNAALAEIYKSKIFSRINIPEIISSEALKYADYQKKMQEAKANPEADADVFTDIRLDAFIQYLDNVDLDSSLAKSIDKELAKAMPAHARPTALSDDLDACFKKGQPLQESKKLRGDAIEFYKNNLSDETKKNKFLSRFSFFLQGITHNLKYSLPSMGEIGTLMGKLDPKKDTKEFEAYKDILLAMRDALQKEISIIPNNVELGKAFDLSQQLINNMVQQSFAERGVRLQSKDETKALASMAASVAAKASTAIGFFVPPLAPVTMPISVALGSISSLLVVKNFAAAIEGREQLDVLHSADEGAKINFKNKYADLQNLLLINRQCTQNILQAAEKFDVSGEEIDLIDEIIKNMNQQAQGLQEALETMEKIGEFTATPDESMTLAPKYVERINSVFTEATEGYNTLSEEISKIKDNINELALESFEKEMPRNTF